ncbi:hypothetical protein D7030_06920 [Flavobacteriaceae bacterium AU392]|nr:hypothetical protein D1817_01500 [Flavobacteriaceae bacterium]RKM84860.1 hypothetical protein D7030_06920 [Flavobacteriaceae bacterium AU392]
MKTTTIILLLTFIFISCKSEKSKNDIKSDSYKSIQTKQNIKNSTFDFPKVENEMENPALFNLTYDEHEFTTGIVFQEVNALKTRKDIYSIIMVLDKNLTNFKELKEWKIGMYIYPIYPEEFENKIDKEKGMKSVGIEAKPVMMGDEVVIIHENLKLKPKSFEHIRFYLYNSKGDTNLKYYKIRDINFR